MTQWSAGTNDSYSRARAVVELYVIQEDAANNRTLVRHAGGLFDNNGSYGGYGTGSYEFYLNGGLENSGSVTYDFAGSGPGWVQIHDHWIYHNAAGQASVSGRMVFYGSSPVGSADTGNQTLSLPDYSFPPSTPAAPTLSRASNGLSVSASVTPPSSSVSITQYTWQYSTDNATWSQLATSTAASLSSTAVPSATQTYYVRVQATSSEGSSGWSASANIAGIPTAPASCSAVRAGKDVLVTAGNSTGTGITGYSVQYSTDGGSTWSAAVAMTSQQYTYTGLTAALTYTFRVFSTNNIGNSATTSSASVFVPAGGKKWDGAAWSATTTAKRYDGTTWVDLTTAKRYDGTTWVDLS